DRFGKAGLGLLELVIKVVRGAPFHGERERIPVPTADHFLGDEIEIVAEMGLAEQPDQPRIGRQGLRVGGNGSVLHNLVAPDGLRGSAKLSRNVLLNGKAWRRGLTQTPA